MLICLLDAGSVFKQTDDTYTEDKQAEEVHQMASVIEAHQFSCAKLRNSSAETIRRRSRGRQCSRSLDNKAPTSIDKQDTAQMRLRACLKHQYSLSTGEITYFDWVCGHADSNSVANDIVPDITDKNTPEAWRMDSKMTANSESEDVRTATDVLDMYKESIKYTHRGVRHAVVWGIGQGFGLSRHFEDADHADLESAAIERDLKALDTYERRESNLESWTAIAQNMLASLDPGSAEDRKPYEWDQLALSSVFPEASGLIKEHKSSCSFEKLAASYHINDHDASFTKFEDTSDDVRQCTRHWADEVLTLMSKLQAISKHCSAIISIKGNGERTSSSEGSEIKTGRLSSEVLGGPTRRHMRAGQSQN